MSCTVVTDKGCQKSKRLSYTAKFKREVVRCTEEKGNHRAASIFGIDGNGSRLWRKLKAVISECGANKRNSLDPREDDFLKLMMQS
jgi:hypothetical protein